jgi:hypothetical protein
MEMATTNKGVETKDQSIQIVVVDGTKIAIIINPTYSHEMQVANKLYNYSPRNAQE